MENEKLVPGCQERRTEEAWRAMDRRNRTRGLVPAQSEAIEKHFKKCAPCRSFCANTGLMSQSGSHLVDAIVDYYGAGGQGN